MLGTNPRLGFGVVEDRGGLRVQAQVHTLATEDLTGGSIPDHMRYTGRLHNLQELADLASSLGAVTVWGTEFHHTPREVG